MFIQAAVAAVGIGMSIYGAFQKNEAEEKATEAQKAIFAAQQKMEIQRAQAMELDAGRRKREMIRNAIAARSMALTTATSQGASGAGGSVLGGAYGGISGQTGVNMLGVNQNLEIGRNMFALNRDISTAQQQYAAAKGESAESDIWGQIGGQLVGAAGGPLGNLMNFGGSKTVSGITSLGMGNFMAPGSSSFNSKGY